MTLGVHLPYLFKIIKCAENDASITLSANENANHLDIEFEYRQRCAQFSLNLIDLETEHLEIPPEFYPLRAHIGSQHFQRIVRDIAQLGSTCSITAESDTVLAFGTQDSDIVAEGSIRLRVGDDMSILPVDEQLCEDVDEDDIDRELPRDVEVSCRFMEQIIKATPLSQRVLLSVKNSRPLLIEYVICKHYIDNGFDETKSEMSSNSSDNGSTEGKLSFFVAPKFNE